MRPRDLPLAVPVETFPRDPEFPQLELATDAAAMRDVFRAHLEPVAGRAYHIEDCVPFRFRCRQSASRCVLQYTLRLVEPGTGRRREQWVTGLMYARPGEAERVWEELRRGDPCREIPERWLTFQPVAFIPELQMVVEVFPFDRRLPHLRPVLGGAVRGVEALLLARFEPGQDRWHALERTIEPTRYRTELGAALQYTVRARDALTGCTVTLRCYVKVYRHDGGEETFRLLRSLSDGPAARERPYAVVAPLIYFSDLRTLVLEEAPGVALRQVLLQGDSAAAARAVARAVAAFNQDDLGITRRGARDAQLGDLELASMLVQWACPDAREEVAVLTAAVARGLEDVPPAPIHGDLKPDHIFVAGDRVIFIDLDSAVLGDPVRDPAHLFAYIAGRVGLDPLTPGEARAAAALFAEEYFRHVPQAWRRRFPLHCAGALIEVASGFFRRQEPEWPAKVRAAIAEARRALAGELE